MHEKNKSKSRLKKKKPSLFTSILSVQVTGPIILTILLSLKDRRNTLKLDIWAMQRVQCLPQAHSYNEITLQGIHSVYRKAHSYHPITFAGAKQQGLQCKNMK